MIRMIFVNLPVTDLPQAKAFYGALGFANEPKFTDDTAACMVLSDVIHVMLLTHAKWRSFTKRPIPSPDSSEVSLCISCESKDEVNRWVEIAGASDGTADVNPPEDHGFMLQRSFMDPDGHVWEPMWMDPSFDPAAAEAPAA